MTVITLVVGITVMLGIGWMAVAIPVVIVLGILGAARALWYRARRHGRDEEGDIQGGPR